jgi:hypothetical protein
LGGRTKRFRVPYCICNELIMGYEYVSMKLKLWFPEMN